MPKVASSNGIPPEYRALSVLTFRKPVTPKEISDFVGTSERYVSKYISLLKRVGFVFTRLKSGTKILSYTLVQEPANSDQYRNLTPKQKAVKAVKPEKPEKPAKPEKPVKPAKRAKPQKTRPTMLARPEKQSKDKVTRRFGSSGEIASSYSVDGDWDYTESHEIRSLIKDYM
jgi:hypothetical protein